MAEHINFKAQQALNYTIKINSIHTLRYLLMKLNEYHPETEITIFKEPETYIALACWISASRALRVSWNASFPITWKAISTQHRISKIPEHNTHSNKVQKKKKKIADNAIIFSLAVTRRRTIINAQWVNWRTLLPVLPPQLEYQVGDKQS